MLIKLVTFYNFISAAVTNVEDILRRKNEWKKKELENLSKMVQNKIFSMQVSFFTIFLIYKANYFRYVMIKLRV